MQGIDDHEAIEWMLSVYLDTLNNADFDAFRRFFVDDATAFSPWAEFADRATGRERVMDAFRPAFARWRATLPGPPYLHIVPEDLHIQQVDDVAIVTFHARDEPSLGRRTLVLRRGPDGWKIVHLHASYLMPASVGDAGA
jgi:ketosteroid isomerase-like protein